MRSTLTTKPRSTRRTHEEEPCCTKTFFFVRSSCTSCLRGLGTLHLLKARQIDRALFGRRLARDEKAEREERVRAADEDDLDARGFQDQRRRDVAQAREREGDQEQRVYRRRSGRAA